MTALYRRYRPETFAEMIGQTHVTDPLRAALRSGRAHHAYLFSGPRGCGKTTSARILARCLNCAESPTDTPCGKCPSCIELSRAGTGSLDVVEIDAASHNGVDDARDIRERALFSPARDRFKIFILDEAHMVTSQGFNALLKIVEEPPEHVKFIFATTEPDKVIGTIRSRTHHYPFRLVPPGHMLDYVQQVCDSENVTVTPGTLPLVVRGGGGSPRDTLSLLDQIIAGSEGTTIEYDRAVSLLGHTHAALLDDVIDALAATDGASAFAAIDHVIQTGQDPRRFVEDLLERLRDLIVVAATSATGAAAVLRGVPADELERMEQQASSFSGSDLSRTADLVNAALTDMVGPTSPRLHLELMIARILVPAADHAARGALVRVERIERRLGIDTQTSADDASAVRSALVSGAHVTPAPVSSEQVPAGPASASQPSTPTQAPIVSDNAVPAAPVVVSEGDGPAVTAELLKDAWPQILHAVEQKKRAAWMVIYTAHILSYTDGVLTLSFPSENDVNSFRTTTTSGPGVSEILREAINDILGVRVKFIARVDPAHAVAATSTGKPAKTPRPAQKPSATGLEGSAPSATPTDLAVADWPTVAIPGSTPVAELDSVVTDEPVAPNKSVERSTSPTKARPTVTTPEPELDSSRYGEAVVREVLGARFIEERPLPTPEGTT